MLEINKSVIIESHLNAVAAGVSTIEEGTALVYALENGVGVVKPATGASGEIFAGIAQSRHVTPNNAVTTYASTVPASGPYTLQLPETPVGTPAIYINDVLATVGVVAAGVVARSGDTITFHADDAGLAVRVVYRYALSQAQAAMLFGTELVSPDLGSGAHVACITTGTVFLDNFVTSVNFEAIDTAVKLAAGGQVTVGGSGTTIDAVVVATPSASGGFLGLRLHP